MDPTLNVAPRLPVSRKEVARSGNFVAQEFALPGPLLISSCRFIDSRGDFTETYSARDFWNLGIEDSFVQDNQSRSTKRGTVRGLHFQLRPQAQAKLVRVVRGRILDVAVDLRRSSPFFGCHVAVELSAEAANQLYIPVGFAHGFCTLEPDTEVAYKISSLYTPELDRGLAWNDPQLGIAWPVSEAEAELSAKDQRQPLLAELPPCFD
jgi:dTDP-4-dehydrorhamnose 3,5-epimerase